MRAASSGGRKKPAAATAELLLERRRFRPTLELARQSLVNTFARSSAWSTLAVSALSALVVLQLVGSVGLASLHVPFDHSEGWNAYNAAAAISGRGLYPDKSSLWFNNYPPLSFYIVGELGGWIGDYIVAGRYIALASTIAAAGFIACTARAMRCNAFEAFIAALFFLASPWVSSKFAGIDDPQMLGHAFACAGFAITARRPKSIVSLVLGALLLTLAEFVKPLFVVQPLALTIWLGLYERTSVAIFVAAGLYFAGLGLVATDAGISVDLLGHLLSARAYSISRMFSHPGQWLITGFLPLAMTLSHFRFEKDRFAVLCGLYAIVAVVSSLFFCGGEGVGGNPTIDLSIAVSLGAAVFVNRYRTRGDIVSETARAHRFIMAICILLGGALAASASVGWDSGATGFARLRERSVASADVTWLQVRQGSALCETPSLCYWAGKRAEVDVWGLSQAIKTHAQSEGALVRLLEDGYFGSMQLERRSSLLLSSTARATLERYYRIDHSDALGTFLVRRRDKPSL